MPQLRICMLLLKILHAATNDPAQPHKELNTKKTARKGPGQCPLEEFWPRRPSWTCDVCIPPVFCVASNHLSHSPAFFKYLFLAVLSLHCREGSSLVAVHGLLLKVASLVSEQEPWGAWASVVAALRHVGSSQIRDRTHVSCIGRGIAFH